MNISYKEDETTLQYILSDYPKEFKPIIESVFYFFDEGKYTKTFLKSAIGNVEQLKHNYTQYAFDMFSQIGYLTEVQWEKGLLRFLKMMEGSDIDWWLTGSCALCLRGINTNPHDVDIMLHSKDLDKVRELFSEYIIEPIIPTGGWVVKYFGVMFLEARIDLAFDPEAILDEPEPADCGPYALKHLETIKWHGYEIKIPPLHLQLAINKKRGREERVRAIENFMARC